MPFPAVTAGSSSSLRTPRVLPEDRVPAGKPIDPAWGASRFVISGMRDEAEEALAAGTAKPLAEAPDVSEHHRFLVSDKDGVATFGYFSTLETARALYIAQVPKDGPVTWREAEI